MATLSTLAYGILQVAYIKLHAYVHKYIHRPTSIHIHLNTCIYTHMSICIHTCQCTCVCALINPSMDAYIHRYKCNFYTYTHIFIYVTCFFHKLEMQAKKTITDCGLSAIGVLMFSSLHSHLSARRATKTF